MPATGGRKNRPGGHEFRTGGSESLDTIRDFRLGEKVGWGGACVGYACGMLEDQPLR